MAIKLLETKNLGKNLQMCMDVLTCVNFDEAAAIKILQSQGPKEE